MFKRTVSFVRRNKKIVIAIVVVLLAILVGVLYSTGSFGAKSGTSTDDVQLNGVYAIDGCKAESQTCVDPASAVYSIRCCSDSKPGISVCPSTQENFMGESVEDGEYTGVNDATYMQAKRTCESKGYRLCTVSELVNSPSQGSTCEKHTDQILCDNSSSCEWVNGKCALIEGTNLPGACSTGCAFNDPEKYKLVSGEKCAL